MAQALSLEDSDHFGSGPLFDNTRARHGFALIYPACTILISTTRPKQANYFISFDGRI